MFTLLSRVVYISQPCRLHNSAIPQTYPKIKKSLPPLVTTLADELDDRGDNKTVVWLEDVGALMVTRLRWRRKKTIMTSRLS
ncbi:unnamed protein product [Brassica oleracea]